MTRIEPLDPSATEGATRTIFERVERGAGRVPNALRVLGRSPAALQAWWDFERALARGSLPVAHPGGQRWLLRGPVEPCQPRHRSSQSSWMTSCWVAVRARTLASSETESGRD